MGFYSAIKDKLIRRWYYSEDFRPPNFLAFENVNADVIWNLIFDRLGYNARMMDTYYQLTTKECLDDYVDWWHRRHGWMTYQPEGRDCDNMARAFWGDVAKWDGWCFSPVGFLDAKHPDLGSHAWNFAAAYPDETNKNPELYSIEPQNGHVMILPPEWKGLPVRQLLI